MRAVVGLALVLGGITFGALVLTGHIPPASSTSGTSGTSGFSEPGDPLRPSGGGGGSKTMK